jgi:hypothetical protein
VTAVKQKQYVLNRCVSEQNPADAKESKGYEKEQSTTDATPKHIEAGKE